MRKHLATIAFSVTLLACNSDSRSPVGPLSLEPNSAIVDAVNGGREGFYFLHPFVTKPGVFGPFDATLTPRARVCALNTSRTSCSEVILATILTGSGLTVDPKNGVFTGQWSSPATLELSTASGGETRYRLEIQVDVGSMAVTLGYADLWVVDQQPAVKESPAGYVDLVRGRTLVFRFGILPGTVGYVTVTPNPVEVAIGGTQQMTAAAYDLRNALISSASFAWSSENSDIAAISSAGLATGLANGSTNLVATTRGVAGGAVMNVIGDPPVAATAVADEAAATSAPGDPFHTALNTTLASGGSTPGLLENDVRGSPPADVVSFGGGSLGGTVADHAAGATVTLGTGGSLQINADGSFSFTPSTGFTGLFTFSYRIQNSSGSSDAPVAIAVGARPTASDDAYPVTIIGNVSINTATSSNFSLLTNDAGDDLNLNLVASPNGTTTINADGTFTFNPSPGFSGTAVFSYTVQNGLGTSAAAAVSIPVSTPIWFVNAAAPAGGDGRLGSPFNCLVDFGALCYDDSANEAGDFLYIASGAYANSGPLNLKATQKVIGQGAASSLATLTGLVNAADSPPLPSTGGTAPLMTSTAAGVVLASSNHLYGFNVGSTIGAGISGDGFGTLTVSNVNLPGPARSGQALGLSNGSIAAGSTFGNVFSTSGADVGISLVNVTGSFAVTGSGAPGSGGTISNTTGSAAIVLSNVPNVSLSYIIVRDNAGTGVSAASLGGFALLHSTVQNNGDDASEDNVRLVGLTGTANIASSNISNASGSNVVVNNTAGALSFSLSSSTLSSDATEPDASNGVALIAGGTSVVSGSITNSTFQGHRLAHLRVTSSGSAQMTVSVVGNTLECANALATACTASFISGSTASFSYSILSNVFTGMKAPIALSKNEGAGAMFGSFSSNTIGAFGVVGSGGDGLLVGSQADGASHTTSIFNNSISNYRLVGIDVLAGGAGMLEATVGANVFDAPSATALHGFRATAGNSPTSTAALCLLLTNNLLTDAGPAVDFRLVQAGLGTMRIPAYLGANDDNAAVVQYVRMAQALADATDPTGSADNNVAGGGGGFVGGAACSTP
jgi:hypothetical protein